MDRYFGQNLSLFVRYNHAPSGRTEPIEGGIPSNLEHYTIGTDTLTAGLIQVITPNLVNDLRGNFSQQSTRDWADLNTSTGARTPPVGELLETGFSYANSTAQIAIGYAPGLFLGTFGQNRALQTEAVDNLSWVHGAYRFRFGADYRRFVTRQTVQKLQYEMAADIYNPDGSFTSEDNGSSVGVNFDNEMEYMMPSFAAYVQDTWRFSRHLTLTAGLRWEVEPAPRTARGTALVVGNLTNFNDLSNTHLIPSGQPFYPVSWTNGDSCATAIAGKRKKRKRMEKD